MFILWTWPWFCIVNKVMPTIKTIGSKAKKQSWGGEESKFLRRAPWRKLRHKKLMQDPLCEICNKEGKVREANTVDHHRPRRFWPDLALLFNNLTSMCKAHHNKKTKIESSIFSKEEWIQVFSNHPDFKK